MSFQDNVFRIVKRIPRGRVSTYKIIAEKLNTKAYQAIGQALKSNKDPDNIPCYKVIRSDGRLGGYSRGLKEKIRRLKKYGIEIRGNRIDLEKYLWKP